MNLLRNFILPIISLLCLSSLSAQTQEHFEPCGFDRVIDQIEAQYPGYKKHFDELSANQFLPAQQENATPSQAMV